MPERQDSHGRRKNGPAVRARGRCEGSGEGYPAARLAPVGTRWSGAKSDCEGCEMDLRTTLGVWIPSITKSRCDETPGAFAVAVAAFLEAIKERLRGASRRGGRGARAVLGSGPRWRDQSVGQAWQVRYRSVYGTDRTGGLCAMRLKAPPSQPPPDLDSTYTLAQGTI